VIWIVLRDGFGLSAKWVKLKLGKGYAYTSLEQSEKHDAYQSSAVRLWKWLPGVVLVIVLSCPILKAQFGMSYGMPLLSLFLAFGMSLLAIQATGATGMYAQLIIEMSDQLTTGRYDTAGDTLEGLVGHPRRC
jgi:hypothetical protein